MVLSTTEILINHIYCFLIPHGQKLETRLKTMWYILKMVCYSAIKKKMAGKLGHKAWANAMCDNLTIDPMLWDGPPHNVFHLWAPRGHGGAKCKCSRGLLCLVSVEKECLILERPNAQRRGSAMGQSLRGKGDGEGLKKSEGGTVIGQHLGCKVIK